MLVGGRYDQQSEGLHISNVTSSDEGDYYCQAVVESGGMFKEQRLTLKLLGILPVCHINTTTIFTDLLCSSVSCFVTALHAMQTRSSDENSVCLSVRLSHACIVTKRKKDLSTFLHHTKDNFA